MTTKKHRRTKNRRTKKQYKYVNFRGGKSSKKSNKSNKRKGKGKPSQVFVDIGMSRPRITGAAGMNQNLEVSRKLAQGMSQSLARGMGQALA